MLDRKHIAEKKARGEALTKADFYKITRKIPHVVGYKNLEELKEKISPYYIRREKKDVLTDLPEKTFENYDIELSTDQRKLYNALQADFFTEFKDEDEPNLANVLVWLTRAKQICDSMELISPGLKGSAKLDELNNIVLDILGDPKEEKLYAENKRKIVIFSQYRQMTDIIVRDFEAYNPLYLHGDVKSEDRQVLIDAFQQPGSEYKMFVSTLQAGGVGITLTAADTCVMFDSWWSNAMNAQAADRLHRIGQKNSVTIISFTCKNSVEERIQAILEKKKLMFSGVFGDDEVILQKLTAKEMKELI